MRYLEELQRKKENKLQEEEVRVKKERMEKQLALAREKQNMQQRIRMGNFMRVGGKLTFYDEVREKDTGWIEYEDASGVPYYYDTVTKISTYERPNQQEIVKHDDILREEYDKVYGQGAYDYVVADRKWKDQCNRDGGYYDANGEWVRLNGYYDENYEFVDLSKGHYDENGQWVDYAALTGTLNMTT